MRVEEAWDTDKTFSACLTASAKLELQFHDARRIFASSIASLVALHCSLILKEVSRVAPIKLNLTHSSSVNGP